MSIVRLLVVGDVHIADSAPGKRTATYKEDILEKLYECVELVTTENITHVLFLGDIFHLKYASRVSHRLVQNIADIFAAMKVPVYVLVGNHDITDGNLNSLEKQPLGTLEYLPNVTLLRWACKEIAEDIVLYPIPGVNGVTLDHYQVRGNAKRKIIVAHQSIVPDITKEHAVVQEVVVDAKAIAKASDANIVLYGHQHRYDGLYGFEIEGKRTTFSNLGAICRLTVVDEDLTKEPKVLVLEFADDENRTVAYKEIPLIRVKSVDEAYSLEDYLETKENKRDIEETIERLKQYSVSSFSVDGVITDIERRRDIEEDVRKVSLELLEMVR